MEFVEPLHANKKPSHNPKIIDLSQGNCCNPQWTSVVAMQPMQRLSKTSIKRVTINHKKTLRQFECKIKTLQNLFNANNSDLGQVEGQDQPSPKNKSEETLSSLILVVISTRNQDL